MAQPASSERMIGDYMVTGKLGSGSFSMVWHAKHRVHGTEVAIKEIITSRLNKKLQESLISEIFILKKINHPNIIRLHDIIEFPERIHLVLEYCRGGDLSMYIQRHKRVPQATAKHFMQQLAAGLKVLRDNNLIHRDLKPQNLLLSSKGSNAVLKIADFGFARSLHPQGLAETLCGSPLYMAPEIMQFQKYDAKADLWSVGTILYQLVIGRTPFTGNNQIQLLQNIMKSTELRFPPGCMDLTPDCIDLCRKLLRSNPVERLTFEEFFNHPYLSQKQSEGPLRSRVSSMNTLESSLEECLPFQLDDDPNGPDGSPSFFKRKSTMKTTHGFSPEARFERRDVPSNNFNDTNLLSSRHGRVSNKMEKTGFMPHNRRPSDRNIKDPMVSMDNRMANIQSRDMDSLELIYQDYVIVPGPPMDVSSSSASASKPSSHSQCKLDNLPSSANNNATLSTAPMPIIGALVSTTNSNCCVGSLESQSSAPSGTSHGSIDIGDASEQPSTHCMTRIKSLQQCASVITELVNEKIEANRQLEAFSIQLVLLAIWKQALHICHTQAASSAMEGSPTQDNSRLRVSYVKKHDSLQECLENINSQGPEDVCCQIVKEFLDEVYRAEGLASIIEPGSAEMPDAMEKIFQSALALGIHGAGVELTGDLDSAAALYSKAVKLIVFLLVEAPSLILNPPFSLTNSDRFRLRSYIDILNNRQGHSRSQRMALLNQQCPP